MSLSKFVSVMLNINEEIIQDLRETVHSDNSITINIKLKVVSKKCPYCRKDAKIHGYTPKKLIHSALANRKCTIVYQERRFRCPNCELTYHENNPFSNSNDCVTYETIHNILKDLKHPEATYTSAARSYNVSKATVLRIFDKYVKIPRKRLTKIISIDEHYFPESDYDALYCFIIMDFMTGEILDVLPDRRTPYLINYFSSIKNDTYDFNTHTSELNTVKYISMDLYDHYRNIAKAYFPQAIICADSFHVLKHLTDDFKDVRLRCIRSTENEYYKYLLIKLRHIFDYNTIVDTPPRYNKHFRRFVNLKDIRDTLFTEFPDLEKAYNLKEMYIYFNRTSTYESAVANFDRIRYIFADCGITEYEEFYGLLGNWKQEIVNSFIRVDGRRINNSFIESKNRIIEKLMLNANGFTNFKRTRNRILYCLNKNDTYTL